MSKEEIVKFLKENKKLLKEQFGIDEIILFGSFARGEESGDSDIDLYVDMPADFFKKCELIDFLEKAFQRKVDVVRKHSNIKKRFIEEIEKDSVYVR